MAIAGVLIVVTLMTNTTDKFIDLLNSSIFPIVGLETKIQKVGPTTPVITLPGQKQADSGIVEEEATEVDENNLSSSVTTAEKEPTTQEELNISDAAEEARQELIRARRAARATSSTSES